MDSQNFDTVRPGCWLIADWQQHFSGRLRLWQLPLLLLCFWLVCSTGCGSGAALALSLSLWPCLECACTGSVAI